MDIRQLRYFVALAEELSFTRAAARLHLSQPPLSYHIAALEDELDVRLFERTSRSVALTDAGRALLGHARAILGRLVEAREHVQALGRGLAGQVRMGLSGSHFLGPLPARLQAFRAARPEVEVLLFEMAPAEQLNALRSGQIDLCLARMPAHAADLQATLLWADTVALAVPLSHPLAGRASVEVADLRNQDFVMLKRDSSRFAKRSLQACVDAGFAPKVVQEVVEVPAMLNLVAAGLGIAFTPKSLAEQRADAVRVVELRLGEQEADWSGDVYLLAPQEAGNAAAKAFALALFAIDPLTKE